MSARRVALCGNPNVGKSTVFNALTGLRQHTGNWTGKTVDVATGEVRTPEGDWQLVDLPGAYSLFDGSPEEMVASDALTFGQPDAAIVVCDAVRLERNLNLALQIAQACPRTLLCVNMLDEAPKYGVELDLCQLERMLGLPVVGVSARNRQGLEALKTRMNALLAAPLPPARPLMFDCPPDILHPLSALEAAITACCPAMAEAGTARFAAMRALTREPAFLQKLTNCAANKSDLAARLRLEHERLLRLGFPREKRVSSLVAASYAKAHQIACAVTRQRPAEPRFHQRLDRWMASKWTGIPIMIGLLALVMYITLLGANLPAEWLSDLFAWLEPHLAALLQMTHAPQWLQDLLMQGVYRVTSWVVAVMLPPMAIFFPLFTLMEDFGLLPRVAFHLDRCFCCCHACGKQALCMCMGLGCNAVGVTGCRIIQSPRERLIAILTNALIPCNGRFPTLIAMISMFFVLGNTALHTLLGAVWLALLILLSVGMTFLCSWLLSRTVLRGLPSAFSLELPPFRRPKIGEVLLRSLLDRTLFVLGRAVCAAAPAGALVWCLANFPVNGQPLLAHASAFLQPAAWWIGMDGVILLSFVLGLPANEIVLPIALMIYRQQGVLSQVQGVMEMKAVLLQQGWTVWTAACVTLFSLFHWPCATTILTIRKETRSLRWTVLAVLTPTLCGIALCLLTAALGRLFG